MVLPAPFSHILRLSGVGDEVVGAAGPVVDKKDRGKGTVLGAWLSSAEARPGARLGGRVI